MNKNYGVNIVRKMRFVPGCLALVLLFGCESADVDGNFWQEKEGAPAGAQTAPAGKQPAAPAGEQPAAPAGEQPAAPAEPAPAAGDEVSFSAFPFNYGGISGRGAALSSPRIKGLRISGQNLSYSWAGPNLSAWGLGHDNYSGAYACLFVQRSDGSWVGGKFDWISSSRTSRHLENVFHGYEGWSLGGVPNPCSAAFVIVSADGRRRTNVIGGTWRR